MRWEDERYVRVFTRDTATWALLPWQSRCVFLFLLRKVDRSGTIELPRGEEVEGLSALLDVPVEVVTTGIEHLLKRQTVVMHDGKIGIPNFRVAQESPTSDKLRKELSRERAADELKAQVVDRPGAKNTLPPEAANDAVSPVAPPPLRVTRRHELSRSVTHEDEASQVVTPNRTEPSRAEPTAAPAPRPNESTRGQLLERALVEEYERLRPGEKYLHGGAKDTRALKQLMAAVSDDSAILARWRLGLSRPPKEWASCSTFAELTRKWTALAAPSPNNSKGPVDPATQNHKEGVIEL